MVKLQLESGERTITRIREFPLWHGKVATYPLSRACVHSDSCFRFGMVKLQLNNSPYKMHCNARFRFGMVKLQPARVCQRVHLGMVSALAW